MNPSRDKPFSQLVLNWFDVHGRKSLPWQQNKTPYRVWISEIMLQQTQVSTVIPYYARFMQTFPTLESLAVAPRDQVMHLWAGLGYYSRARNIHRAAMMVVQEYKGEFPSTLETLMTLPGIGRSTAGAILAIAFNQRATILDGNVKRVLARFAAVTEAIDKKVENRLWDMANDYAPHERIADYTQAMMDLGATVCIRGKPHCTLCPLQISCSAWQQDIAEQLPKKKTGRKLPIKSATFLIIMHNQRVLLQKRSNQGTWGGLWSLPEIASIADEKVVRSHCKQVIGVMVRELRTLTPFRHTFSHYHLDIHPVLLKIDNKISKTMEAGRQIWYNLNQPDLVGLPKPVQKLLEGLNHDSTHSLSEAKQRS